MWVGMVVCVWGVCVWVGMVVGVCVGGVCVGGYGCGWVGVGVGVGVCTCGTLLTSPAIPPPSPVPVPAREFPDHPRRPLVGVEGESQSYPDPTVAEESDGWYRLRTVTSRWSSDEGAEGDGEGEGEGGKGKVEDLRNRLKVCTYCTCV